MEAFFLSSYGYRKKGLNFFKLGIFSVVPLAGQNKRASEAHSEGLLCPPTAACHLQLSRWFVHDHILISALFGGEMSSKRPTCHKDKEAMLDRHIIADQSCTPCDSSRHL